MNEKAIKKTILGDSLTEQKLDTSEILLSNMLSNIKEGLVILDHNSNYLYVNKEASTILGKRAQDLIGKNIWEEFPEKEGDLFFDKYQEALKTQKSLSFENYFKSRECWFENRIIPSSNGMLLFFHEISDKKISENEIKSAYNIINKSSSVAILCKNERDFPVEFASENVVKLLGYTYTELLTNKIKLYQLVHPDNLKEIRTAFFQLSKSKNAEGFKLKPFRIITKNKETKWIQANIDAIRNENSKITHIQGIIEDITARKKTEDLFFKSEQRIKDQFNNTPLASIMWDLDFRVLEWNNSAEKIFGYTAEEAIGKHAKDLIIPPNIITDINKVFEKLLAQKGGHRYTNKNTTKSGNMITCVWYNSVLKDIEGNMIGVSSLGEDITERLNSKKLLEKSEKKYRDIFEKSIDAVLVVKNNRFVDCNKSTLGMFGYADKESLLKMHPSEISPETQKSGESSFIKAERMIKIALENGSNRFRWYHKHKNGHVFPAEVSLTRIDESGNTPSVHAIVKDITERIKREELEDVLYNISKTALTDSDFNKFSLFVRNELHKIIDTNNFYIAIYDEETDMITTPVFVDDKEEVEEFSAKKSLTGYVIKTKKSLILSKAAHKNLIDKGIVDLMGLPAEKWLGVPLLIQNKCIGAIVVQSYTNENAYNENDVNLLEFVADQISTIILRKKAEDDLNNALIKAQESDRLKSSFLANMSHEIRTPMNGIIGFSELFLEPNLLENKRIEYANIVINSSKRLLSIVNDILDISKIEAGGVKLNYENVNINKLLDDLEAFYKPLAQERNIFLNCVKGLENFKSVIKIDKMKLSQVLTNLLSNAFKFTDKGGVEFGYTLVENNLQFYVKDTGIGIEDKLQDKIFDRFIQANVDLVKKHKGTGLGLAISKKLTDLFKGEMWLTSSNQGTTIYFTIPYIKSKAPLVSTVVEEQKPIIQMKNKEIIILVAEDEEYNMMYINELFSKTNFKIIEANNGKQAIELSKKNPEIDLVLMDIKMPVMDGKEAMIEIKKEQPLLPIIALSAFAMESDKNSALKSGFDAYLTKPIDRKLLFSIIGKYIN